MGSNSRRAVFLDRDGVLNKSIVLDGKPFPPKSILEVDIPDGVKEGLEQLKNLGFLLIVVTNQPDVARGTTTIQSVKNINNYLTQQLALDDIYCCFHDSGNNCNCRKPKPGMIYDAVKKWDIDLAGSFLIGDRWKDIETGKNAGVKTILIDYGYNEKHVIPDYSCLNFTEATQIIKSLT
jgi:D-glycero-D-manno-heptose 1,7-bisphosphate phosphatase